jgi:hypothetical protein
MEQEKEEIWGKKIILQQIEKSLNEFSTLLFTFVVLLELQKPHQIQFWFKTVSFYDNSCTI